MKITKRELQEMCRKHQSFGSLGITISFAVIVAVVIALLNFVRADAYAEAYNTILEEVNSQTELVTVSIDNETKNIIVTERTTSETREEPVIIEESEEAKVEIVEIIETSEVEETVEPSAEEFIIEQNLLSDSENTEVETEVCTYFGQYTDIGFYNGIDAETLDTITDWYQQYQDFDNPYKGKGYVFMQAQEITGINALWLYVVSFYESGWGTSDLAVEKGNFYGIGAWDTDITKAVHVADSFDEAIINGAIWIKEHYYDLGMTSMYLMNSTPGYSYAPGNTVWIPTISENINTIYWRYLA